MSEKPLLSERMQDAKCDDVYSYVFYLEALLDIERLASLIHDKWISWSRTLVLNGEVAQNKVRAWEKYWVPYEELSEEVKDMDREWAHKVASLTAEE